MTRTLLIYLSTLLVFLGIDYIWLTVMGGFYRSEIGSLMRATPNVAIAGLFYAAYVVGIVVFAIRPGMAGSSWVQVALLGALFGALAYGTYDLTNLATLNGFTAKVAVVDIAWGTLLTTVCAVAGHLVAVRLKEGL